MKKTYEEIVKELADLDVQYLNLHRSLREEEKSKIYLDNFVDYLCDRIDIDREQVEQEFRELVAND